MLCHTMTLKNVDNGYSVHFTGITYTAAKFDILTQNVRYPQIFNFELTAGVITEKLIYFACNNWAILRDWHGGVLTKLVISYHILELASIFWYHWMCNIHEGTIHMLTYSYTEINQPQRIKIRATPTFLVCLSPRVKCTQHPVWGRSLTFMLCSLYPVYLG